MYNQTNCKTLTNFWKEGTYTRKYFSAEGLEIMTGTTKIEYLYKCCKINAVKLTDNVVYQGKKITGTIIYYTDGKFTHKSSSGYDVSGKWYKKCCNLVVCYSGVDNIVQNKKVKAKAVIMKNGCNYKADIYQSENCKCVLQFRHTLTKV